MHNNRECFSTALHPKISKRAFAALFCRAACFPWAVKIGRCAVIFFPSKRLCSFHGFVPAQLLVVQGDALLLVPGYTIVLSSFLSDTYQWVTARNSGAKHRVCPPVKNSCCLLFSDLHLAASHINLH